tara:strand:+ start:398 stop:655 length:258 start_codon:yes stop_codon:yes gene_type:complete
MANWKLTKGKIILIILVSFIIWQIVGYNLTCNELMVGQTRLACLGESLLVGWLFGILFGAGIWIPVAIFVYFAWSMLQEKKKIIK